MRARVACGAKQLVDIALPIADMDAAAGFAEQSGGVLEIEQPAQAFLFLEGNARWGWILRFSAFAPLKSLRDQHFTAAKPNGNPAGVSTKLECSEMLHGGRSLRQRSEGPCLGLVSKPMFSRQYESLVVSCKTEALARAAKVPGQRCLRH